MSGGTNYFSKDFDWEQLRDEIENDVSLRYHCLPFNSSSFPSSTSDDSEAWKSFHKRHCTGRFFKERRYLLKEFPELLSSNGFSKVLEVGCGNGSTVLPILRGIQSIDVYACDCSSEVLKKARDMVDTAEGFSIKHRFHPFLCDFSLDGFPNWLVCPSCRKALKRSSDCPSDVRRSEHEVLKELLNFDKAQCCIGAMDFVTLIFTLSAVQFHQMPLVISECFSVLKPGGLLLFRDYGLYDMTMLRFEPNKRVGFREYVRSDGTRSYFFSIDTVKDLFLAVGFVELELEYCCIKSVNRRSDKSMRRVWVHGKFQKPF